MINKLSNLKSTLMAPKRLSIIPENSHWLAGEGAGSWFHLELVGDDYRIVRYSPDGRVECTGYFNYISKVMFNIYEPFEFLHLSHCQSVIIGQSENMFFFERKS
jgi:hypothetical protein